MILRKGGIHEDKGAFRPDHEAFWLFPTRFHEEPGAVIPSKRADLKDLAAAATTDVVALQYFARVDAVHEIIDRDALKRLQGQHIWSEHVLEQRFDFGRSQALFALLVRVYRLPTAIELPLIEQYGGCKSWIQLERPLPLDALQPVLDEPTFTARCGAITQCLHEVDHAIAHP